MNLSFENIGDIKQASINFEKLTVISGENDVGKSTVGKLMFAIIQSCNTYNEVFQREHPRSNLLYSWIYTRIRDHQSLSENLELRSFFSRLRMDSNRRYDHERILEKVDYFIQSTEDLSGKEFLEKVKYIITDFYNDEINLEYSSADGLFDIINNEFRSNALRYGSKSGQVSLYSSEVNKFSLEFKFSRRDKVSYKKVDSLNLRDVTIIENPAILQYLPTIFTNNIYQQYLPTIFTNNIYQQYLPTIFTNNIYQQYFLTLFLIP